MRKWIHKSKNSQPPVSMSRYSLQACDEGDEKSKKKSTWMDRWMTRSSKHREMAGEIGEHSNQKVLDINASPWNISEYQNRWRQEGEEVAVASKSVLAEAKRVEITYETLAARLESEPVSVFKFSEKIGRISAVSFKHESINGVSQQCNTIEPSNFKFLSTPTETRQCRSLPGSRSKYQEQPFLSLDKVRLLGLDKVAASSSSFLPYVFKSRQEEIGRSSSQLPSLEHIKRGGSSGKKDGALQLNDLSSTDFFSASHPKPHKRKHHFTFSQNHPGKLTRLEDLDCGSHVHQNDELRAFSTVQGGLKEPWISPDMSNPAPEQSASQKLFTQLIGAKHERTASKNESSAETDTMDINAFPSITSSASYKDTKVENSAKSHSTILREALGSRRETELPDVNQEPPSSLSAEKKNIDFSTSRTESLDVEHLHLDQAGKSSSSSHCLTRMPDASSKWVKRLKPTLPGCQAHGKTEDFSFTAEIDKLYNKIPDCNRTNLTATFDEIFGKSDTPELDRTTLPLKDNHDSMSSLKKSCDINLSHPWIQRWCRNQAPRAPIEVDCSKTASDDYNIKEFPSIAAMALMGKAMNGLQACNFQNKGSFIVWGKGRPPGQL